MAGASRADARGPPLDDRGGAARCSPDDVARAGAAEPRLRRLPAPARRRHRRLGRRLAGDDRPRQPRGAVAGARAARGGDRGRAGSSSRRGCRSTRAYLGRRVARPDGAAARSARVGRARARARGRAGRPGERGRACRSSSRATRCRVDGGGELGEDELVRLFRARGEERQRVFAAADRLRREVNGDEVTLRRDAQRPVHERLLLPLRLLRVLEGQAGGEPARRAVPRPARRDRAPRAGGVGARRDRGLPPGRDPSRRSPATTTRSVVAAIRDAAARTCTCTRSRRSRSGRARRRSGCRSRTTSRGCATLGLGSLPGTAAEILDDEVRAVICPDKVTTDAVARGARGRARASGCART